MPARPENALDMCEQEQDVVYHETYIDTFWCQYRGYKEKDKEVLTVETKVSLYYMCLKMFANTYTHTYIYKY